MNDKKSAPEDQVKEAPESKASPKNNRILLIGILVGVVVLNSVMAFVLVQMTRPAKEKDATAAALDSIKNVAQLATSMGATTADAPIEAIVNVAETDGQRFLKAAVIFEYDDVKFPNLSIELVRRAPKFKDLLLDHLSKLTIVDLTEISARDKIRKDLLRIINHSLPPEVGEIRDVLFTEFILQ